MNYYVIGANYTNGKFKIMEVEFIKETDKTITVFYDTAKTWERRYSKSELNEGIYELFTSREEAERYFKSWRELQISWAREQIEKYERMVIE